MGFTLEDLERKERSKYPAIDTLMLLSRSTWALMNRIDEAFLSCRTLEDTVTVMAQAGAWVAAEDVCPLTDWINVVMPYAFDEIEYDGLAFDHRYDRQPAIVLTIGRAKQTITLDYLTADVVREWHRETLRQTLRSAEDYGFERCVDDDGDPYFINVPKPETAAA